ncbi:MAG: cupin domain-containing protein [Gemmatimonadota bacterium]
MPKQLTSLLCAGALCGWVACRPAASRTVSGRAATRVAAEYDVETVRGSLRVRLVEVVYAPGDTSVPHSHDCPVVAHVIDGNLRSGLNEQPESVYTAGRGFYEPANSRHRVSGNASASEPTRFLAVFLCPTP